MLRRNNHVFLYQTIKISMKPPPKKKNLRILSSKAGNIFVTLSFNFNVPTSYVECLKTIFTNVHKKLVESLEKDKMNEYFNNIKKMSVSTTFKNRDKFKFMDILELFE